MRAFLLYRSWRNTLMICDTGSAATVVVYSGTKTMQYVLGLTGVKECCTCKPFDSSQKIQSTLILAQKNGFSTGIVTTTRITHATPAASYAHSRDRNHEVDPSQNKNYSTSHWNFYNSEVSSSDSSFVCDDIASQLITNGLDFNVILGGGSKMFYQNASAVTPKSPGSREDGKNLFEQWLREQQKRNRRYKLVFDSEELKQMNLDEVDYLFGLLAPNHLDYEIGRTDQPSLSELTEIAVKILSRNPKGYLLLVEGGRIDHGHHSNQANALSKSFDIPQRFVDPMYMVGFWVTHICATRLKYTRYALTETLALEKAVNTATKHVNLDETLMVVTADHSHAYGVIGYANRRTHILDLDDSQVVGSGSVFIIPVS
ncbi:alkaline phosphatase [Paragonimus westermani]|uniref:alkaline phosphatase n=1 Tax=Paragonimus westermani TaxID=34504 RepID=A0A5J4NK75_9TREM|nr:alkaline phosphatase [Paragonimus westermani]